MYHNFFQSTVHFNIHYVPKNFVKQNKNNGKSSLMKCYLTMLLFFRKCKSQEVLGSVLTSGNFLICYPLSIYQWRIQDFPDGGGAPTSWWGRQAIISPNFYRKLHENERIWTERGGGGRVPGATP